MTSYHYLIIGGGMAASAAINGIRSVDAQGAIGLITAEIDPPYDRPPLSKGLWQGDTSIEDIRHELPDGVGLHTERHVTSVEIARKAIKDNQDQIYTYEKLLLATGGRPKQLPFAADKQILYYRTLHDYCRLRKLMEAYERVAVIGGGFIGSELAAALRNSGKEVILIFPEKGICARLFPEDVSGYLNRYYKSKGVTILPRTQVKDVQGKLGAYVLQTDKNEEIAAEVIVAGIGIQPNTELAEEAGLRVDNGILVNHALQTSDPDIYAAGDVANFEDIVLGKRRRVEHEDNVITMGKAAGRAMAGANVTYDHSPMFYSDLFDLSYEAVGELNAKLDTFADWQEDYAKGVIYYLQNRRVRGVLLWNVWDQVEKARQLIADGKEWHTDQLAGKIT